MGRGKGSAYDGNLVELRGWHVAAICQYVVEKKETKYNHFLFYCLDDQKRWREKPLDISGTREGVLDAFARVVYEQPSWKACQMKKGKGHGKPVDMGPDSEDVFVQIMGPHGYDTFNLRYWDGSVVYEPGKDKASIEMIGNKRFLTDSKKETIDGIRKEALHLVKQRGDKKKEVLKKYRENDSPDESSEKKEVGLISNGTEKENISDRPVASQTEDIPGDSQPVPSVIPFPISSTGNVLAADRVAEKRQYAVEIEIEADTYISDQEMVNGQYYPKDCSKMSPEGQGSWGRRKILELKNKAEDLYEFLLKKIES